MPSLNFQSRFSDDVSSGRKTQSVRASNRFKMGDPVFLFAGMRTKQCRRLGDGWVTRLAVVSISEVVGESEFDGGFAVKVGGEMLGPNAGDRFARADGFKDAVEMCEWFRKTYGLPFEGYLVGWHFNQKCEAKK